MMALNRLRNLLVYWLTRNESSEQRALRQEIARQMNARRYRA